MSGIPTTWSLHRAVAEAPAAVLAAVRLADRVAPGDSAGPPLRIAMSTIPLPQGAVGRLAAVAAIAAALTLGSYLAVLTVGSASVRQAELRGPAPVKALRAAALENDCMNKVVTQRVKGHKVPSPLELDALRASCGLPARS